jgi:serine/threonine protein kinase
MRDLLKAVVFIHENNIMHRDIKCANLLLSDGKLKLGDFGTAHRIDPQKPCVEMKGTLRFMAPEVCKEEAHDCSCDIWSIGCTLVEMLTGQQPMPHIEGNYLQVIAQLTSLGIDDTVPIPEGIKGHARSFITQCLTVNASLRSSARTLLSHPFVTHTDVNDRKKNTFQDGPKKFKKAVQKLRMMSKVGMLKDGVLGSPKGKSGTHLTVSGNTVAAKNGGCESPEETPALHRYTSEYFDRKFSGWGGEMDVPKADSLPEEEEKRKFSGWGCGGDNDDDDKRHGSVWCAYDT